MSGIHVIEVHTPSTPELRISGIYHPITGRVSLFADAAHKDFHEKVLGIYNRIYQGMSVLPQDWTDRGVWNNRLHKDFRILLGFYGRGGIYEFEVPWGDVKDEVKRQVAAMGVKGDVIVAITPFQKRNKKLPSCDKCGFEYDGETCIRCAHIAARKKTRYYQCALVAVCALLPSYFQDLFLQWVYGAN